MNTIYYTIEHFLTKFAAIPEEGVVTGANMLAEDKRCALGWCMVKFDRFYVIGPEYVALNHFAYGLLNADMAVINDGRDKRFKQETPKQRVLAALKECARLRDKG
jgi:hypothetical protein